MRCACWEGGGGRDSWAPHMAEAAGAEGEAGEPGQGLSPLKGHPDKAGITTAPPRTWAGPGEERCSLHLSLTMNQRAS